MELSSCVLKPPVPPMSTFEDDRYHWRETYFVLLDPSHRPLLEEIRKGLEAVFTRLEVRNVRSDEAGFLEVLSVASYDDYAALDIVYQCGEQVRLETEALAEELLKMTSTKRNREKIEKARTCTARLDVLHFEQIVSEEEKEESAEEGAEGDEEEGAGVPAKWGKEGREKRARFVFDPEEYVEPPVPFLEERQHETQERLDPNTLILVLELLSRVTDGVALDPAGGSVVL